MPNARQWHLILSAVIAAELIALLVMSLPGTDATAGGDRPRHHGHPAPGGSPRIADGSPLAQAANLIAEKQALEDQIRNLHAAAGADKDTVQVTVDYLAQRRFGRASGPIDAGDGTRELLRISAEEALLIDAAKATALGKVREIESTRVRRETAADGSPIFIVDPWPDQGAPAMRALEADLAAALGEARGAIVFAELRDSTFIQGGKVGLRITPDHSQAAEDPFASGEDPFASGEGTQPMRLNVSQTEAATGEVIDSIPLFLSTETTPAILERFGHVLGVGTAEELSLLFQPSPSP